MPLDNEKLKKVYSTLKEGGYDQDYNTFVKGFSGNENYGNRKQVYDLLTQNGAQVGKNYADFMQRLYTPSPKQTQVQQPRVNRGSMVRAVTDPLNARGIGGVMQNINKVQEVVKKAEKEKANGYQPRFDGVTKRSTEAKIPTLADMKPMPAFEPTPHFDTEKSVGADGKIVSKAKPKQIFDGSGQPKYVYQDSFTGKTYDPNDSDPHTQEMIKRGEDAASYVQETPMPKVAENDLNGLASDIDKRMLEIENGYNEKAREDAYGISGWDIARGDGALISGWKSSMDKSLAGDMEYQILSIARKSLSNAHEMIEEAEKSKREGSFEGFIKGAGRGFVNGVFDPETWDFGASSLKEAMGMEAVLYKFDNGQKLTKAEQTMLDAKAMEMAVNAFYGSDLGRGYKAGKVTAEAIPFMIEMAINPASGAGKSAASMLTRYALKRFGKKGLVKASKKAAEKAFVRAEERALAKGLSEAAAKAAGKRAAARATTQTLKFQAAKTGARVLGDVAGASTMAATTGAMRTAADAVSRHSGDVKFDVDDKGNIVFAGHDKGDDWGTAIKKAFANTAIENYSEMFGAYLAPIGSFVGKAGEKLLSKIGLGKVTEMLGKLSSSDIAKAIKRIEEKGQFNGVIGEDLEEQVGGIMNALIVGDQTLDTADGTGVFNMDNQIDTFLGVGLMGGIFSAARLGGGLVGGQGNLEARRAVRQAGVAALKDFKGKELIWDHIKTDVDNASNDQLKQVVKNIVTDGGLSDENKKAALQYVRSSMQLRGVDAIRPLTKEEAEADAHNVQEEAVHNRGFEADAQERKDIAIESADPDNAEAQQAWAGVEQRIDDDATRMADAFREKALQMQHNDGSFHTATLKEKDEHGEGKQVFIVSGHVQMTPDGTMIDREASDKTIVIFDPSTGERKMIDPSSDFGLSSVDKPTTSEELEASIERERQGFIQAQLDDARGTIRLSVGQQFVLPDGNEAVVVALDESGEDITAMLADGTQVNIQRAELQQAHDEQALAEYRQRKGIEEPTAEDEEPEQPEQGTQGAQVEGAPSSYEPDMELVLPNERGGESRAMVMGRVRYEGGQFIPDENGGIVEYYMDGEVRHEQISKLNDRVVAYTDAAQVVEEETPPAEDVQAKEEAPLQEEKSVPEENDATPLDKEELAPAAEEDAEEDNAMPMRDNGEEDWQATTPERAHSYIFNEAGLSRSEGNEFVAAQKDAAQRALNKAKSAQAPRVGTSIGQYKKAKAKHQEKIENAQRVLDYWNAVQDIQVAIQHKEREQKEAEDAKAHEEAAEQMQAEFEARKAARAEAMERRKAESLQEDGDSGTSIVGVQDGAEQIPVLKEDEDLQGKGKNSPDRNKPQSRIQSFIDEWERLKKEGDAKALEHFSRTINIALNGYAQARGVEEEFKQLRAEIDEYAKAYNERVREKRKANSANDSAENKETPTDFTPSPRKEGEDLLDYAARVDEESKADHKRKREENKVNTSPSDAQKGAGNYKKGHIKVDGLDITIEQPKGSIRTGKDASGKEWRSEMHNTYGYIRGTESVDGDHIDIFLSDNPAEGNVFVVDQVNKDGSFDEHKVMYGFTDIESAKQAYLSNYEKGWQGLGNITEVSKDEFKKWIDSSKRKTKPFAEYSSVKTQDDMQTKKPTEAEDFTRQDLKELEDFQKNTDTTGRTAIDIDRYDAEDLFAPLKLDGKPSNLGVLTVVSDKITDPASQIAVYDYSDEIDDKTNSGWQKWGDLADEYNKTVDKDDKAQERGDTATLGFRTVDAAVKFNDWLNTSTQTERTEEAQTDVASPAMTEDEYLASKGLGSPMSDHMLDKTRIPHGETARQKARREREAEKAMKEHAARKKDARKEYQEKLANGELREPTKEETEKKRIDALIRTANGHGDNPSVLAARRVLDKRGIDWQKKDGQINTQTEENNAHNSKEIMHGQKNVQLQQTTTPLTNDTEAKQKATETILTALNKAGIEVIQATDEQAQEMLGSSKAEPLKTPQGTVYGWTVNGKIYLTKSGLNPETPVHEYTHLWAEAMIGKNKQGWDSIKTLLKDTPVWNEVINDPNYSNIKDNEDAVASEVLSRISGRKNAAKMEAEAQKAINKAKGVLEKAKATTILLNLKRAIEQFWHWVNKNVFGIKDFKNIDEVTDRVLYDLLSNTKLTEEDNEEIAKRDKLYLDAVERGDMETAQRMVNEAAAQNGYVPNSEYQGSSAFNGAAPYGNGYFLTKEERKGAYENDEFDGDTSLDDYVNSGIDPMNLDYLTNDSSYRHADDARKEAIENLRNVFQNKRQTITMYRSVPSSIKEGSFRNGDWVTPSYAYAVENARMHGWGNKYRIIEQEVPISDVWFDGNDIAEFGYGNEDDFINDKDYLYSNTKNNQKLPDAVTYDDKGNVIPLSKRFNKAKSDPRFQIADSALSDEEKKIVETAKANDTYMKAPNGKPTNLNEKQWAQVRTKAFKNWFGDWEKAARIEKLRKSKPVKITEADYEGKYDLTRNSAKQWAKDNIRGEYMIADTGEKVNVSKVSINEVLSHGERDAAHLKSISSIGKLLHNAIFITETPNAKDNDKYESYRYYIEGVKIDGEDYTAKIVVGVKNGKTYYDHRLTKIEKGSLLDSLNGLSNSVAKKQQTPFTGKDSKLLSILRTNSSKVVDENGEPMVVYHGTLTKDLHQFSKDFIGSRYSFDEKGFFFISNKQIAKDYSYSEFDSTRKGEVIETFLSIKHPLLVDQKWCKKNGLGNNVFKYNDVIGFWDNYQALILEESENNDGVIITDGNTTMDVAFDPNQIKSAVNNNGEFSLESDDIRFRKEDGENQEVLRDKDLSTGPLRDREAMRNEAEQLAEKLHTPINVVEDANEITHPNKEIEARRRKAKGWYNVSTGEVVVVLANHKDAADVAATICHEVIAHKGLRELVGEAHYDEFLDEVYDHLSGDLKREIDDAAGRAFLDDINKSGDDARDYKRHRRIAVDELFGSLAEKPFEEFSESERSLWQKIKEFANKLLDRFLDKLKLPKWFELGDNELRYILWRSKERLERGKEDPIDQARDIVKREDLGLTNEPLNKVSVTARNFDEMAERYNWNWDFSQDKGMEDLYDIAPNVTTKDYYLGTFAEFELVATNDPTKWDELKQQDGFRLEHSPKSDSEYLINDETGEIYRKSDHWGVVSSCRWILNGMPHQDDKGKIFIGKSNVNDFKREKKACVVVTKGKREAYYARMREVAENIKQALGDKTIKFTATARKIVDENLRMLIPQIKRYDEGEKGDLIYKRNRHGHYVPLEILKTTNNNPLYDDNSGEDDVLYRDSGETRDIWLDQSMGLQERTTAAAARLANNHRDNKVFMQDAMRAIGANLTDLRKAMRLQKDFDRTTAKRVYDLARILMEMGYLRGLNQQEVSKLLSVMKNSIGKQNIDNDVQQLMDLMVNHQLKQSKSTLESLEHIKGSKVNAKGVEVQGALDAEGQAIMAAMKAAKDIVTPCAGKTEEDNGELTAWGQALEDVQERMGSEDNAIAENAALEYQGMMLAQQWFDEIKQRELEEASLRQELNHAQSTTPAEERKGEAYKEYIGNLKQAIQQNKIDRAQAYMNLVGRLTESLRESIEGAKAFKLREKARISAIQRDANLDMEGRPAGEHYVPDWKARAVNNAFVSGVAAPLATMDQMLRLFGNKSANGEGYLYNRFERGFIDARQQEIKGYREKTAILDAKAAEIFGGKIKTWADLIRYVSGLPDKEVVFKNGGIDERFTLSQGNLMYIYMVNKMLDGRLKLSKMGLTSDVVEELTKEIDPRLIKLADWMQEDFLVQTRNEYNETHKRVFGASMAAIENYFPLKIRSNARIDKAEDLDNPTRNSGISTTTGSIIKRRRNSLPLDLLNADALNIILSHITEMEHWNAFVEYNRDLNTLRTYKRFRNGVENMTTIYGSGKELWKLFNDLCQITTGSYIPPREDLDKSLVNLAKGVTAAKVSFRLFTALKQFLSFPAYFPEVRAVHIAKCLAHPKESWDWCMENLPIFNERWNSRLSGDPRLLKTNMDWKMWRTRAAEIAMRIGMTPNAFVDALTVCIGARAMYMTRKGQYLRDGYTEEEADKRAKQDAETLYNQTQQSSEGAFLSRMQVDRGWISVLFSIFRNSSMAYTRQVYDAMRNLRRNLTPGGRKESIAFMTKQYMNEGFDKAKAEENAKRKFDRQIRKDILRVATFGYLLQFAWNLGAYLPYMLFGGDDDEKEVFWQDVFAHSYFGSLEGLTGGDVISQVLGSYLAGNLNPNSMDKDMPLTSDLALAFKEFAKGDKDAALSDMINLIVQSGIGVNPQSITDSVLAIMDACGDDPALANEATIFIARILQVPQSQIDKLYFDEVGLMGSGLSKYTPAQLAARYARYKVKRGHFSTPWAWDDDVNIGKAMTKANREIKERTNHMGLTNLNEAFAPYEEVYQKVDKQMDAYEAAKKTDYVKAANMMVEIQKDKSALDTYQKLKSMDSQLDKMAKRFLSAKSDGERQLYRKMIESYKPAMLKVLQAKGEAAQEKAMDDIGTLMEGFAEEQEKLYENQ